jgi:glycosyltransferase involved in cell wall biosynthesis
VPEPAPFRPVILTPTYNNARTLSAVLESLAALSLPVLVVNDGSTDTTCVILQEWRGRETVIHHDFNRGKGAALRTGFAAAHAAGFTHALTFDTDGQHNAADVPALLDLARANPDAMIIGARDRTIENYPAKNRLGRSLSNLGVRLESGARVTDCQSGLRVYPLAVATTIPISTDRFGFEVEIITRFAWAGYPILESPIRCTYEKGPDRVSHFRPGMDTWRALKLHARLLALSILPASRRLSRR